MMNTMLLSRKDVAELITLDDCIMAVEQAFRLYGEGKAVPPKVLGMHSQKGGLHIKAGILDTGKPYMVAKLNSNFQHNTTEYELPLIQGVVVVYDGENGRVLAVMDSIEITILRTGAATAVAAKYLANPNAKKATIVGCGNQGVISLKALMKVCSLNKVYAYDVNRARADKFAETLSDSLRVSIEVVDDLSDGVCTSDICITCTPSTQGFLQNKDVLPGTFVAAVGADSEDKQELAPELLSKNKVVTDFTDQCKSIGELHHAVAIGLMSATDVYAELGEIICGKKRGRASADEIIVFDSTGTALQDVAVATVVYERAIQRKAGLTIDFAH